MIDHFIIKEEDLCCEFCESIDQNQYPQYFESVEFEMTIEKLKKRIQFEYYRSLQQLFHDIDLIHQNAALFNEDTSLVISYARQLGEALKTIVQNFENPNLLETLKIQTKHKKTTKNNQYNKINLNINNNNQTKYPLRNRSSVQNKQQNQIQQLQMIDENSQQSQQYQCSVEIETEEQALSQFNQKQLSSQKSQNFEENYGSSVNKKSADKNEHVFSQNGELQNNFNSKNQTKNDVYLKYIVYQENQTSSGASNTVNLENNIQKNTENEMKDEEEKDEEQQQEEWQLQQIEFQEKQLQSSVINEEKVDQKNIEDQNIKDGNTHSIIIKLQIDNASRKFQEENNNNNIFDKQENEQQQKLKINNEIEQNQQKYQQQQQHNVVVKYVKFVVNQPNIFSNKNDTSPMYQKTFKRFNTNANFNSNNVLQQKEQNTNFSEINYYKHQQNNTNNQQQKQPTSIQQQQQQQQIQQNNNNLNSENKYSSRLRKKTLHSYADL